MALNGIESRVQSTMGIQKYFFFLSCMLGKRNARCFKGLIRREDLLEELELLKNVFISNGYPEKLVLKPVHESWAKETMKAVLVGIE